MYLLRKPQVKPVENANGEENRTGKEKTPSGMTKAVEDVCQPSNKAGDAQYAAHHATTHLKKSRTVLCKNRHPKNNCNKKTVPDSLFFSMLFISIPLKVDSQNILLFAL